jgi:hypothetical protein
VSWVIEGDVKATVVGVKVLALWRSYGRNVKMAERMGFYVVRARELGSFVCLSVLGEWGIGREGEGKGG